MRHPSFSLLLAGLLVLLPVVIARAQDDVVDASETSTAARQLVDRYLQILLRRPGMGTSLDKVYEHHAAAESLDGLIAELQETDGLSEEQIGRQQFAIGLLHLKAGSADAAVTALQSAAATLVDDAMVSYHLGQAQTRAGNDDAATAAYQQAVDRNPPRTVAADIFLELGKRYQQQGESERANAVWAELTVRFPNDRRVGERIARIQAADGDFAAASQRFGELAATAKAAGDAEKAIELAVQAAELQLRGGEPDQAREAFQVLLAQTRPGSFLHNDLQSRIESILREANDPAALIKYYEEQVSKHPETIPTRFRYAKALSSLGRDEQAAEVYRDAIERAPSNVEARLGLISALRASGNVPEALDQYRRLSERDPTNTDHLIQWGELALQDETTPLLERRQQAAAIWKRLSDQRSNDPLTLTQIAKRLRAIGRDAEALQLYREAIALAPGQPEYREYLGEYQLALNQTDEAIATWKEMAAGPRESLQTLVRLAEVFESFGLTEQVVETVARASAFDPSFFQRLQFASMLSDANEFDMAFEQIEHAAALAENNQQEDRVSTDEIDLLLRSGRLVDAIEHTEAAVEETPRDPLLLRRLALLQQAAGRWLPALENIERAAELSPDDVRILTTAVAVFEEAFRLDDAVVVLQRLAELDRPSRFEHLSKAAQLQLRLGRVEEALETGQRRIALNPSSAASYLAFSELCFAAARDEEAVEALRTALQFDPRNRDVRHRLASTLANRYQTDEAIDLYWQAFDAASELDERLDLVGMLTPLHQRIGRFASLIDRLTVIEAVSVEAAATERALLIAAAHEAAGDIKVALNHLEVFGETSTPQSAILERAVQLAMLADDIERAITHQRRLLDIDDTSVNRKRLFTLALRSENNDDRQDAVERLCSAGDQPAVVNAMDEALRRGRFSTVVELGDAFVPLAGTKWEVPGQLRMAIACIGQEASERADRLIVELRERIAGKNALFSAEATTDPRPDALPTSPRQRALQLAPLLSRLLQIGNPSRCPIVQTSTASLDLAGLRTSQQLEWLIDVVELANAAKQNRLDASYPTAGMTLGKRTSEREGEQRWSSLVRAQAYAIFGGDTTRRQQTGVHQPDWQRHLWGLVQSGDATALDIWLTWLKNRQELRESDTSGQERFRLNQLTAVQLDWLEKAAAKAAEPLSLDTHLAIYHELLWGDRRDSAEAYIASVDVLANPSTLPQYLDAQRLFLELEQADRACAFISAVREIVVKTETTLSPELLERVIVQTVRCAGRIADASERWEALQLLLATEQRRMRQVPLVPTASESTESLMVYRDQGGQSTLQNIAGPISSRLVRPAFLESVFQLAVNAPGADEASAARLAERLCGLPQQTAASRASMPGENERKSGQAEDLVTDLPTIVAFFLQTWSKDWKEAEETLASLQVRFPDESDLQLEQARLLETQGEREQAISVLAAIRPGDPQTLQKRDLRMLRLASYAGQPQQAREAADRLSVMPLDTATQMTLVGQLKRMRLDDLADAVLQRVRRQAADDSTALLDVAFAYERQNRPEQAAEAAYDVIRRDRQNLAPSPEMVRAVRLLQSLQRLDPLIEQHEERAAAAGEPLHLLRQLSKIYQVVGLHDKMLAIESKITEREPANAQAQAQLASMYVTTHRYHSAVDRFLIAFQIDPSLIADSWQDFERAVQMSDRADAALAALLEVGIERIPETVVKQLSRFSLSSNRLPTGTLSGPTSEFYRQLLRSQTPVELVRNLRTTRKHAGAAIAELAAAPLRSFFADPATYTPASPIWNQALEIKEGVFTGGLDAILDTLNDDPDLRASIRDVIDQSRSQASSQPMADALLAAVEWESGERRQAQDRLRSRLEEPASELAPALVWQTAQRWQADPESESVVQAMDEWLVSASMPDAWKSFQHGIYRRILERHLQQGRVEKARESLRSGFLQQCPQCEFTRQAMTGQVDDLDTTTFEDAKFIAGQLRQLQRPIDATRIDRSLLRRLQPDQTDFRRQPIFHQPALAVRKLIDEIDAVAVELSETDPTDATESWLQQLFPLQHPEPFFDLLVDVPEAWIDRPVDSSTTRLLQRIAEQPQGKAHLNAWCEKLDRANASELARPMRQALQALIALCANDDEASTVIRTLVESLDSDDEFPPRAVLQFILIAEEASSSPDPAVAAAGGELATSLSRQAFDAGADHHFCRLIRIVLGSNGHNTGSDARHELALSLLRERLDQIAPRRQTPLALDAETAALALEIGDLAIHAGDIQLSLEAAYRALAGGQPAFRSTSDSEISGIDLAANDLYQRAHAPQRMIAISAASLAQQWLRFVGTTNDDAAAEQVEQTLMAIVLPERQSGNLNLYLSATMGTAFEFSSASPQPPNLLTPLARIAARRGSCESIRQSLAGLNAADEMIADITTAQMVLANQAADDAAARGAAQRLIDHVSLTLPSWQEMVEFRLPKSPFTPTFAKKKLAGRKLDLADRLLLLCPAGLSTQQENEENDHSTPDWNRDRLLLRVIGMLLLDQETSRQSLTQLDWLAGQIADRHPHEKDSELAAVATHLQSVIRAGRDQEAE